MNDQHKIPMEYILAMTHRLPIHLNVYTGAIAYFNQGPGSVIDDRAAIAEYILEKIPQLRAVRRPQSVQLTDWGGYNEQDLAIWDAWFDVIKDFLGEAVAIPPIPAGRRDLRQPSEKLIDRGADPAKITILNPNPQPDVD